MAKLSQTDSRRMYSWWWNSHISPKNSKWLQENLTDMDVKVKSMIKLIEEDADSFARRAEMYYKKRPELMKMVEEFYRAYRALAERYDNATGVIRQARHTMSEAFPNQVPPMPGDDSPASSVSGSDPRTPMSTPNGEFANESDSSTGVERVRRGLNFDELDEKEQSKQSNGNNKESYSKEILVLKEALAKLEAEKKLGLLQYQQSADKLSQLEAEISKTREDFRMLTDHANNAENEVSILKEKLTAFEAEKESKLQEYQKSVEKLNERASTSEIEAQSLRGGLDKLAVEKDAALDQYMHCLEIISTLENKLRLTEEDATALKERAEKSESEVEILRQTIAKLTEEKEAAAREYQRCLELISGLEQKLLSANEEIDNGFTKLKSSEEQCLELEITNRSLHSELESLMSKFGTQTQDLTEKQKELGRLWTCIQEERLRFVEAETAFQTLQHLHAQTQEELRAMASELQNRAHLLQVGEIQNRSLQDEVMKFKEENKRLDELNLSSSLSIKDMQNEIYSLMEAKGKLEEEVVHRLDQRNALQQEIYCLKEEINDLNKKHVSILDQVHELGLDPESLGSSVKELRAENSCLKETCQRENSEKTALLKKMEVLEQLLVKNSLLETSLSDLNAELEAAKRKIETLEQSCRSFLEEKSALLDEKATLMTQLQEADNNLNDLNKKHVSILDQVHELGLSPDSLGSSVKELRDENSSLKETCQRESSEKAALLEKLEVLEQLLVKNSIMESSLSDLNAELEAARGKIEALEQSCQLFLEEKSILDNDKATLMTQLQDTNKNLGILSKNNTVLEKFLSNVHQQLEVLKEKSKVLEDSCQVLADEKAGLMSEKDGLASQLENTWTKLEGLGRLYEELEGRCVNLEKEKESTLRKVDELNISLEAERRENVSCIQTSEAKMRLLLDECREKKEDLDQALDSAIANELEIFVLRTTARGLKENNCSLLILNQKNMEVSEKEILLWEQKNFEQQSEIRSMKNIICKAEEENMESSVQLSVLVTWVRQLVLDSQKLEMVKNKIEHEREALLTQIEGLNLVLKDMEREKSDISEEKRSLMDNIKHLEGNTDVLEEENYALCSKVLALENLSLIFRIFADEKFTVFREIGDDRNKLRDVNATLIGKLEESKSEIVYLKERLHKTEDELSVETESGKKSLSQIQEGEEKINQAEKQKLELSEIVENLRKDLQREKSVNSEEKRSLMDNIRHLEGNTNALEEENYALCSKVLALENLSLIFRIFADEKFTVFREIGDDRNKLRDDNATLIGKLEESKSENIHLKERLHKTEDELSVEIESGKKLLSQMALQLQEGEEKINQAEKQKLELNEIVENLRKDLQREKSVNSEEKRSLMDNIRHLEGNTDVLEEENYALCSKVLALENLSLIFRIFADEKFTVFREIGDDRNNLLDVNATLIGKLEESKSENIHLKERLHKAEDELSVEIESGKKLSSQMALQFQEGEEKINQAEKQKLELNEIVENMRKDLQREISVNSEEKRSLMDNIRHLEGNTNVLEEENYAMCSKVLALENLSLIFRIFADEKLMVFREIKNDQNKLHDVNATLIGKLEESTSDNVNLKERLHKTEDELSVEIENGKKLLNQMSLQLQEAEEKIIRAVKQELVLNDIVENLQREKSVISEEKRSLMDNVRHLEGKTNVLEEENYFLCSKVLALENLSLIFRIFADEKLMMFREIRDDRKKLYDVNASLIVKLEESKIKDFDLKERLHRTEDELSVEIESGKKLLNEMALQLQEAEDKINLAEKEKLELNETVENLRTDYNEIKTAQVHQENHILKLSADNDYLNRENNFLHEATEKLGADLEKLQRDLDTKKIEEEKLHSELQKKVNEINELEILGASIFGQLHHSGVSQLIYEHKFHELIDALDSYMDQNAVLKSQLAAYGPEIVLLKECISSLENQADIHIKFPNPENEELQDAQVRNEDCNKSMKLSSAADLHNLTVRLQTIGKAAAELKDVMVKENGGLRSKLDETTNQLEFLQSNQNGRLRRSRRRSEITSEADNILLTKDIVLDQISDGSSYSLSNRQHQQPFDPDNQMVELWETSDPNGNVGLTMSKSKKTTENNSFRRLKSIKKQNSTVSTWELSKGSNESFGEGNTKTKVLERLDSDVQKLVNLQITVQDLKRKLEDTEKGKRGKAIIECEALKGQLEEADVTVVKLFELNERLVKNIDDRSFSDKSSFDMENEGKERRRRVSKQAQRMSEKIGRLQLEVQKLQFVLLKMDEGKDGKSRTTSSESKRRVVLRDYLYGVGQRRKKKVAQFCACAQPSTVED